MNRETLSKYVILNFKNDEIISNEELIKFIKTNKKLSDKEFLLNLETEFPLLETYLKYKNGYRLKIIANCLIFFVVLTSISIVSYFLFISNLIIP